MVLTSCTDESALTLHYSRAPLQRIMNSSPGIDLLLIGKTGHGKSATGNNILGRKVFATTSSTSSVTKHIDFEYVEHNGRVIKVVDSPGVCDTRVLNDEAVRLVTEAMEKAIFTNPEGYHAFLLVLRFGQRFTGEEQATITFLKQTFGRKFVKEFCVLLMTGGDMFENENEDTGITFEEWCESQTGPFKELLEECGKRIVLFNNLTRDKDVKTRQLERLISVVDHLSAKGQRYTDGHFERARVARDRALVEAKEPMIRDEVTKETSLILQKLQKIQDSENIDAEIDELEKLMVRTETFLGRLTDVDNRTGALHNHLMTVKSIKQTISDTIKCTHRVKGEREKYKKREEQIKREAGEAMERMFQEFQLMLLADAITEEIKDGILREQNKKRQEMEEKRRRQLEAVQMGFLEMVAKDISKERQKTAAVGKEYQELKKKSDQNILSKLSSGLLLPFRKIASAFSSKKTDQ